MWGAYLYVTQRLTAFVLAPLVLIHLGLIVYAVQGGLTAAEILNRTHSSPIWGWFYSVFVIAAALHASIGLRSIAAEYLGWQGRSLNFATVCFGLSLIVLGARAVAAVVL
jgi:fumarate reductase subunit C